MLFFIIFVAHSLRCVTCDDEIECNQGSCPPCPVQECPAGKDHCYYATYPRNGKEWKDAKCSNPIQCDKDEALLVADSVKHPEVKILLKEVPPPQN